MLGKFEGRRRSGHQRIQWQGGITDAMNLKLGKLQEMGRDREGWHAAVHGVKKRQDWVTEQKKWNSILSTIFIDKSAS